MTAAPAEGPQRNGDARHTGGISAAPGLRELGAEAEHARTAYGEGALIMCDRLVRIFAADVAKRRPARRLRRDATRC